MIFFSHGGVCERFLEVYLGKWSKYGKHILQMGGEKPPTSFDLFFINYELGEIYDPIRRIQSMDGTLPKTNIAPKNGGFH